MGLRNNGADREKNSDALASSLVVQAGPCRVYDVVISWTGPTKVYAQLHATAAVPTNGAVPKAFVELDVALSGAATATGSLTWSGGRPCRLGAVIVISTTAATLTIDTTDKAIIDVTYT